MSIFKKSKAFTIAELLLVLFIIGIISTLTVPTLRKFVFRSQFERGAQKAYLTINEAFDEAIVIYGSPHKWKSNPDGKSANDMITEQLKLQSNGLTEDGMKIDVNCSATGCDFTADINGPKKEPNLEGKDIFNFKVTFAQVETKDTPEDEKNPVDEETGIALTDKILPQGTAEKLMQNNWRYTDELWNQ